MPVAGQLSKLYHEQGLICWAALGGASLPPALSRH